VHSILPAAPALEAAAAGAQLLGRAKRVPPGPEHRAVRKVLDTDDARRPLVVPRERQREPAVAARRRGGISQRAGEGVSDVVGERA